MSDERITVAKEEEFTISLQTIATAGYLWKVETLPAAIELLGTENQKPNGDKKPGDSTLQIFRFRARDTGEHQIKFALGRPWEDKAIESHTVTARVIQ